MRRDRLQDLKRRLYVMVKAEDGGTRWSTARAYLSRKALPVVRSHNP
jgi:hypothetical protein